MLRIDGVELHRGESTHSCRELDLRLAISRVLSVPPSLFPFTTSVSKKRGHFSSGSHPFRVLVAPLQANPTSHRFTSIERTRSRLAENENEMQVRCAIIHVAGMWFQAGKNVLAIFKIMQNNFTKFDRRIMSTRWNSFYFEISCLKLGDYRSSTFWISRWLSSRLQNIIRV